jgi:hypothetical protein
MVKWLLEEGGANINESSGSHTALTCAATRYYDMNYEDDLEVKHEIYETVRYLLRHEDMCAGDVSAALVDAVNSSSLSWYPRISR